MNQSHIPTFRPSQWIGRLLCRLRAALAHQRDRAELAALSAYELRDIGLSHADAMPVRHTCSQ